jgi:sulfur relay (sulfurtransferase) complex TusBCD TusD component (DsrE family)
MRGLLCYNLNNSRNKIDGARNKAKGLIAGRSDLVLYYQGKAYMIEIKTPDGSQQPAQKEWQQLITAQGFQYHICRSLSEFQSLITCILK